MVAGVTGEQAGSAHACPPAAGHKTGLHLDHERCLGAGVTHEQAGGAHAGPPAAGHETGHHHDHDRCQVTHEQVQEVALGHPDGFGQGVRPHHCCKGGNVTCAQVQVAALGHLDGAGHGVGHQHWEGDNANVTHAWLKEVAIDHSAGAGFHHWEKVVVTHDQGQVGKPDGAGHGVGPHHCVFGNDVTQAGGDFGENHIAQLEVETLMKAALTEDGQEPVWEL
jgi:hypothetical protein